VQFRTGPAAGVKLKQNAWNKLITHEEPEFDLEGTEEGDLRGAFGADSSDVRDWLNKSEEDFGYLNLTKEKIMQQAEGDEEN
jgi:hypothetical protein